MDIQLHEIQHPALQAALERFEGGMGEPFDPSNPADYSTFLAMLEEAVHDRISRKWVVMLREATAKAEAETREALEAEQRERDARLAASVNAGAARIRALGEVRP
jgi:hypothetical protein